MIDSCPVQPTIPIALAGIGPAGESTLQRLCAEQLPNVHCLQNDGSLAPELLHKVGLLILVAQLDSLADCNAVLDLAGQVQSSGFGANTLYVVMQPSAGAGERQKVLAHYSLQTLEMHVDATVVLPGNDGEDLCTWLTERVADLAQAVDHNASVRIGINDLTNLLRNAGPAVWVSAQSEGVDRADAAAKALCNQHARHAVPGHAYQHAMVYVQGARQSLKLSETRVLLKAVSQQMLTDTAHLVCCVSYEDNLGTRVRVSALLCRPQARTV